MAASVLMPFVIWAQSAVGGSRKIADFKALRCSECGIQQQSINELYRCYLGSQGQSTCRHFLVEGDKCRSGSLGRCDIECVRRSQRKIQSPEERLRSGDIRGFNLCALSDTSDPTIEAGEGLTRIVHGESFDPHAPADSGGKLSGRKIADDQN